MLFWMAMALIVVGSIAVTYAVAARDYESVEWQRRPSVAMAASQVIDTGGVKALQHWLASNKNVIPDRDLFIVGPGGEDILGRHLSESAERRWEFINRESGPGAEPPGLEPRGPVEPRSPLNFRPSRQAPQLVAADGTVYTILSVPRRPSIFGAFGLPGIPLAVLGIALIVSALASWWLAEHLSAPIRRIQEGARAVASEQLDVRVSAGLGGRKDELAVLARDFDAMADQLKATRSARTQLFRDISHELRSPLARMRVALGLARQPLAEPGLQLDRLEREIERLDSLIGHVLRLARLQGSESNFTREAVDIDEILQEVVQDANFEGAVKNCTIRLQGSAGRELQGNRELLHSAIENVLRNAVKYSPSGKPVEVRVAALPSELEVRVRDQGPGVPGGALERIFEPFFRVAESRDRDSGGEGIGLAITAQVLKAHGGAATARNLAEGGLEVRLVLPLPPRAADLEVAQSA